MTVTDTETAPWGNPAQSTFVKRFIRLAAAGDLSCKVHIDLQAIVERLLHDLGESDLVVATVEGWPANPYGNGVQVVLTPDRPQVVAAAMDAYGFVPDGEDGTYVWGGSREDARAMSKRLDDDPNGVVLPVPVGAGEEPPTIAASQPPAAAELPPEALGPARPPFNPADWSTGLPGERDLDPAADPVGRDVLFLQAYLGEARTGVYDPDTIAAVDYFKSRRGLEPDGIMDNMAWRQFLPRFRANLHPGDTGRNVRILTAAMVAAGYLHPEEPAGARFNVKLQRQVREMQGARESRRTGRITTIEWSWLLAYPWG